MTGDLVAPGHGRGLRDVPLDRYLLQLIARKEIQVRYRGSVLGILWSYIKPAVQFAVFYVAMGVFLGLNKGVDNYAVYLFSGIVVMNFFNEAFGNAARSIVGNGHLIKKIYLPREIFPLAAVGGAGFMFLVQLVILFVAAIIFRALPAPEHLLWILPSVALILVYGLAIGLFLAAVNVYLRDIQYLTEVIMMLAMWASPIVYSWQMVTDAVARLGLPAWVTEIYAANPITIGVLGFHRAFWGPGTPADYPSDLGLRMLIAGVIGLVLLLGAQRVFTRLQGNFAQEL